MGIPSYFSYLIRQYNDIVFDIRVEWTKVGDYWRAHKLIEYSTNIDELDEEYGA